MPSKEKKRSPRLEVKEDATVAEQVEAVTTYLDARYGDLTDEELHARISEASVKLKEIEDDLATADEGLQDALAKDESEIADLDDLDAPVAAKHYQRERERLSRLVPKRWRLRKLRAELDLTWRLRRGVAEGKKARELYEKLQPLEEQMRKLEQTVRRLQDERRGALERGRDLTGPTKHLAAQVIELQTPDLGGLTLCIGLR